MSINVEMKNPKSGEIKGLKVGWSWTLFFFSGFWGIPLFLRGLKAQGFLFLGLSVVAGLFVSASLTSEEAMGNLILFQLIGLGLSIWMGVKGNEMTAKRYLENGWQFTAPHSDAAKFARGKWGLVEAHA